MFAVCDVSASLQSIRFGYKEHDQDESVSCLMMKIMMNCIKVHVHKLGRHKGCLHFGQGTIYTRTTMMGIGCVSFQIESFEQCEGNRANAQP